MFMIQFSNSIISRHIEHLRRCTSFNELDWGARVMCNSVDKMQNCQRLREIEDKNIPLFKRNGDVLEFLFECSRSIIKHTSNAKKKLWEYLK